MSVSSTCPYRSTASSLSRAMMMMNMVLLSMMLIMASTVEANIAAEDPEAKLRGRTTTPSRLQGAVYYDAETHSFHYKEGGNLPAGAVAYGNYEPGVGNPGRPSGFGRVKISTNSSFEDLVQMRGAGYLEGAITRDVIPALVDNWNYLMKQILPTKNGEIPDKLKKWLNDQDDWIQKQIKTNYTVQCMSYCQHILGSLSLIRREFHMKAGQHTELVLEQFEGLVEGYNAIATRPISRLEFKLLNGQDDLSDILSAIFPNHTPDYDKMNPSELMDVFLNKSHCSALVKVTGNFSELFAGHSTWYSFNQMVRLFKHYDFQLNNAHTASRTHSYSSYPGFLSSADDFYMMKDSNLVLLQTTNPVLNKTLYNKITHDALFAWHRVRTANLLASSGEEWAHYYRWPNSGTSNNQYMVVNMGLFSPGKALSPGTLWVVEQIPGLVVDGDMTQQLERGYWPSYNVPYFETIYNESGFRALLDQHSRERYGALAGLSYQMAPRAQIFRRDQGTVVDMDSFKAILRYNDYKNDPISNGNPYNAICSRGDLAGKASGCYDTKVTSWSWFQQQKSSIINGPTQSHGLPPFSWKEQNGKYEDITHEGQPDVFDFDFQDEYFSDSLQWKSYA